MRILTNARIYTLDPDYPIASTLVIDQGTITEVGETTSALAAGGLQAELVDLGGRTVIPGLTDAHIHLQYYSLGLQKVDCETNSQIECLERVAARARQTPPAEWILGHGWNQNNWPESYGSCAQLDRITTEQPIYLTAKSLHAGWVNTIALRLAGITSQTPDPPGGRIQRDEHGIPTGILFEKAMALVENSIPEAKPAIVAQAIKDAQPLLWQMGLTGAHDFDRQTCFTALQLLHEAGDLKLRVTKSLPIEILPEAVEIGLRSGFGDDFLQIGSIKAFSDGALGPRTAAMLQPYEGEPDNRGIAMLDAEEIFEATGDKPSLISIYVNRADLQCSGGGTPGEALENADKAFRLAESLNSQERLGACHWTYGKVYGASGDYQKSGDHFQKAILGFEGNQYRRNLADTCLDYARTLKKAAEAGLRPQGLAESYFSRARGIYQDLKLPHMVQECH